MDESFFLNLMLLFSLGLESVWLLGPGGVSFRSFVFVCNLFFFDCVLLVLGVLVGVAFFTLMERKVLGYVHFRKGPTKVFYFGELQPIGDALKLFTKEFFKSYGVVYYFFLSGPLVGMFLMLFLWSFYSGFFFVSAGVFSLIFVFSFLRLGVYFLLFSSWGSNSKYSLVGGYRAVSQAVSYEVSMIFFVLVLVYVLGIYDFVFFFYFQGGMWFSFSLVSVFFCWGYVCLAERNRTPFDFSEGESELVSGFNVEYGGGVFSLVFICEYGIIIFLRFLTVSFFFGSVGFFFKFVFLCVVFVWVRCCFPRYRYDLLMDSAWKSVLPLSILFLVGVRAVYFLVF
jgi:NADH-ubiquinone oxidoreductase chain 1